MKTLIKKIITAVLSVNLLRVIICSDHIDSTVLLTAVYWHAGLAAQEKLFYQHSNAAQQQHTGFDQLLDEGRENRKKVRNTMELSIKFYLS